MKIRHRSAARRFLLTAVTLGTLMILDLLLILSCILFPENRVLTVLAGIVSIWALVAFACAFVRFHRHVIQPGMQMEKMLQSMAHGDCPPPMPPHLHEYFPEFGRSANLLRDRLQYLESALRTRQAEEQRLLREGATVTLLGQVYSRLMAHLFQPISLIGGYMELLRRNGNLSPDQILAAEGQLVRMRRMLETVIGGMEAAASQDADRSFDLNALLFDFDAEHQNTLKRRRITLASRLDADLPRTLHGSRKWLTRELRSLLHVLEVEAENGNRLELRCSGTPDAVRFTFADPANRDLAAEYRNSRDADRDRPGDETPLILLELRLAANGAGEHHASLTVQESGSGTELVLTLDHTWLGSGTDRSSGAGHFAESSRLPAPAVTLPETDSGRILLVTREPETAVILQAWHPAAEWVAMAPENSWPEEQFSRILAIVPVEIAERYLQKMENELCRRDSQGADITVIDPGNHTRFRRHLQESGIHHIHDSRLVFREFGASAKRNK